MTRRKHQAGVWPSPLYPIFLHHPEVFPYAPVPCWAHEQDLFPNLKNFQESLPRLPSVLPSVHEGPRLLRILYVFP